MMDNEEYRRWRQRQEMGEDVYQAMLKQAMEDAQKAYEADKLASLGFRQKRTDIKPVVWPRSLSRSERKRRRAQAA